MMFKELRMMMCLGYENLFIVRGCKNDMFKIWKVIICLRNGKLSFVYEMEIDDMFKV